MPTQPWRMTMKLTKSGLDHVRWPQRLVRRERLHRRRQHARAGHEGHGRDRALHAGRPHGLADPPQGPDDLRHRGGRPGPSVKGGRSRRCGRATASSSSRARTTGTALPRTCFHVQFAYQEADEGACSHTTWGRQAHLRRVPGLGPARRRLTGRAPAASRDAATPGRPPGDERPEHQPLRQSQLRHWRRCRLPGPRAR